MTRDLPEQLRMAIREFFLAYIKSTERVTMTARNFVTNAQRAVVLGKFNLFNALSETLEGCDEKALSRIARAPAQLEKTVKQALSRRELMMQPKPRRRNSELISPEQGRAAPVRRQSENRVSRNVPTIKARAGCLTTTRKGVLLQGYTYRYELRKRGCCVGGNKQAAKAVTRTSSASSVVPLSPPGRAVPPVGPGRERTGSRPVSRRSTLCVSETLLDFMRRPVSSCETRRDSALGGRKRPAVVL